MRGFVRRFLARRPFPHDAAITAIERHHNVAMNGPRADAAERPMRFRQSGPRWNRGEDKNAISPNDWRRRPSTRDLHFPPNILRFAPFERWVGSARNAVRRRSTPLRPVTLGSRALGRGTKRQQNEDKRAGDATNYAHTMNTDDSGWEFTRRAEHRYAQSFFISSSSRDREIESVVLSALPSIGCSLCQLDIFRRPIVFRLYS